MTGDPRKLKGAAALAEIVERLTGLGAEVQKAIETGSSRHESFDLETPFGRMSGKMGVRVGPAARPSAAAKPKRPTKPAAKPVEPLVDVYINQGEVIVTTEIDDADAKASVEGRSLKIVSSLSAERVIDLPYAVKPSSLRVRIVNGVLEATMRAEGEVR